MKKLVAITVVFLSINGSAQVNNDSLLILLDSVSGTARITLLKELCWENRYSNPSDAIKYGLEALSLTRELGATEHEASINNYLGVIQRNIGDHATALEYFFTAQGISEAQNNMTDLAYAHNNIGDIYNLEGKYQEALENEFKALTLFEETGDSLGVSYCCHQIALVFTNLEEHSRALQYDERSMNIRRSMGNMAGVAYSLISIGMNHLSLGEISESLESLRESGAIFEELGDHFGLAFSMHHLGIYYRETGNHQEAISYFTLALELGRETDSPIRIRNAAQELSEIYAELGRFEEAYRMYILFKETYDSLYREENLVKLSQLVLRNEFEQRELVQQAEIRRQKQVRNYFILSLGLAVIVLIVLHSRFTVKRRANIELQQRNRDIETQKEKLEELYVSLRSKNDELSQQYEEIAAQKDHLVLLNNQLEEQKRELNETLDALRRAQSHLVQAEKMASLGQVTAGVAHELNNPLNFICTSIKPLQRNVEDLLAILTKYDSIIEKDKLSARFNDVKALKDELDYKFLLNETGSLLDGIYEGASRSEHIVKDLRTFSRMDENEFKGVNIHEGIDSTLLLLKHKVQGKITIHKAYGKLQHVECLPGKLNQVFMNIITNSILAIEEKGDIYITTSSVDDKARISIRDTGKGMSREIMEHIFEPFYTTREVGKGTGLGLSISYSIIEEHGGTIEVQSEPGAGSEFIITLPFTRTES